MATTRRHPSLCGLLVIACSAFFLSGCKVPYKDTHRTLQDRTRADIRQLETALDVYMAHNDNPPTQQQGLAALISKPTIPPEPINWRGPYIKGKSVPKDLWGHNYIYTVSKDRYRIISYGADGKPGGSGENEDISVSSNE